MGVGMKSSVVIGIPFYRNPHLVAAVASSIERIEINGSRDVRCVFVIDSPEDGELIRQAEIWQQRLSTRFPTSIIVNEKNIGFVKSANAIFRNALDTDSDTILVNSDVVLYPDTIREMIEVADSDPMIGFVSPRTNNTTICTFPLPGSDDAETSRRRFLELHRLLPKKSYVPTVVGFCMFCRASILREIGLFDEIYLMGYNEENDLIMRANRIGFSCAVANWAYAYHALGSSFDVLDGKRADRDRENRKILVDRYPEYASATSNYFESAEYRALILLSALSPVAGRPAVAFDWSTFGEHYNGTVEYSRKIMEAFCAVYGDRYDAFAICSESSWKFHELSRIAGLKRSAVDSADPFAIVIKLGQPFSPTALALPFSRGAVVLIAMLDPIAYDCLYLRTRLLQRWWRFVFDWADVVVYISEFVAQEFRERFRISSHVRQLAAMPSINIDEYPAPAGQRRTDDDGLLIIGNHFHHKYVRETVRLLRAQCPDFALKVLGTKVEGTESHESGLIDPEVIAGLFANARAIVFPTFYEGFGFPIIHALAWKKPIFARRIPVFEEINERLRSRNIHFYDSTASLTEQLRREMPKWIEDGGAHSGHRSWRDSAVEIEAALSKKIKDFDYGRVVQRLDELESVTAERAEAELHWLRTTLGSRSRLTRLLLKAIVSKFWK